MRLTERQKALQDACISLVETINATGGIAKDSHGLFHPVADPEWIDLGSAYMEACYALKREPKLVGEEP
jgi:hypothetical protein